MQLKIIFQNMSETLKKSFFIYLIMLGLEFVILILVVRHAGWSLTPYLNGFDTFGYITIAKNLVENKTFSINPVPPLIPNFFRLPGYPFWLAFIYWIFGSFKPAVFGGILIFTLSAPLMYLIMREVFSEKLAFWAGVIFALEPRMAFSAPFILSEQIFLPLFLLSIFFTVKLFNSPQNKRYIFIATFLLGFSALTKVLVIYLFPVFITSFFLITWKFYSIKKVLAILSFSALIFIIVVSPWLLRNRIVLNTWGFSGSTPGVLLYWGHLEILERYLGMPTELVYRGLIARANKLAGPNLESRKAVEILTKEATNEIRKHWGTYLWIYVSRSPLFFITDGYKGIVSYISYTRPNYINLYDLVAMFRFKELFKELKNFSFKELLIPLGGRILWLTLTILSFIGIYIGIKNMSQQRLLLILFAFFIIFLAILVGPDIHDAPRHRLPVNGFMIAFALVSVFYFLKIDFKISKSWTF